MPSALVRRRSGKMIAGVGAPWPTGAALSRGLLRLGFVILGLVGAGELVHLGLWLIIPEAG